MSTFFVVVIDMLIVSISPECLKRLLFVIEQTNVKLCFGNQNKKCSLGLSYAGLLDIHSVSAYILPPTLGILVVAVGVVLQTFVSCPVK